MGWGVLLRKPKFLDTLFVRIVRPELHTTMIKLVLPIFAPLPEGLDKGKRESKHTVHDQNPLNDNPMAAASPKPARHHVEWRKMVETGSREDTTSN